MLQKYSVKNARARANAHHQHLYSNFQEFTNGEFEKIQKILCAGTADAPLRALPRNFVQHKGKVFLSVRNAQLELIGSGLRYAG
jgi:hypothetical protein